MFASLGILTSLMLGAQVAGSDADIGRAEAMIDAFYSFDPEQLSPFLAAAAESRADLLYYQGWAEGGNYEIVERAPCQWESEDTVACPITVRDDPVLALGTGFNVTDTFHIKFDDGEIVAVDTTSNDQPVYYQAREWVMREMPEVMEGPCLGYYDGGSTPADCARAITEGYRRCSESDDFPGIE